MSDYLVRRAQAIAGLVRDTTLNEIEAGRLARQWEIEAGRRRVPSTDPAFWMDGDRWIRTMLRLRNELG